MASVELRKVYKSFGTAEVIHGIDLTIADREFVVLVGPSGCGKSTLLRMIAGLEEITGGEVAIGDRVVNELRAKERDIAMVFQNYALYPHMTVYKNMAFSLRLGGMARDEIDKRVQWAAKILDLSDLLERQPRQLSGGQRQRVAMGRAIVRDPQVFLFDEPLSNLDAKLRVQMRAEIRALHQRLEATSIYVTHDQLEAMTMADRIVVINDGEVEQVGTPIELYDAPCNTFVAGFLGSPAMNFFQGVMRSSDDGPRVETTSGLGLAVDDTTLIEEGRPVVYGIRPEHLDLVPAGGGGFESKVVVLEATGAGTQVIADSASGRLVAAFNQRHALRPGEVIGLKPQARQAHVFDAASGQRL